MLAAFVKGLFSDARFLIYSCIARNLKHVVDSGLILTDPVEQVDNWDWNLTLIQLFYDYISFRHNFSDLVLLEGRVSFGLVECGLELCDGNHSQLFLDEVMDQVF